MAAKYIAIDWNDMRLDPVVVVVLITQNST